jgi:cytoskeleton protein RodZ
MLAAGCQSAPGGLRRTRARRRTQFLTGECACASLQCAAVEDPNHIVATLRRAREQRELTIEGAAAEAGIPLRYARLLEGEAPAGPGISDELYLIPFFRRYATALGLSPEDLLPDFLGQVQELPPPTAAPLKVRTRARRRAPWRALAVVAAIAAATLIIMRQAPERPAVDDEHWADADQAPDATVAGGERAPNAAPSDAPGVAAAAPGSAPVAAEPAPSAAPEPGQLAQTARAPAPAAGEPAGTEAVDSGTAPAADGATHELHVSAAQETWFSLVIDDEPKRNIILQPGEARSWTAAHGFTLTVGNAGGITVSIDGRELPPIGRAGQVVRNLRLPEGAPPASG